MECTSCHRETKRLYEDNLCIECVEKTQNFSIDAQRIKAQHQPKFYGKRRPKRVDEVTEVLYFVTPDGQHYKVMTTYYGDDAMNVDIIFD
jgi:hypothetical protein